MLASVRRALATATGATVGLAGMLVFGAGIPTRQGGPLVTFLFPGSGPLWAYAVTLVGGPVLATAGMAFGIRYGNLQRYNENYDPETGTIEGENFSAWVAERVRKESLEPDDPPPKRSGKLVLVVLVTVAPFVIVGAVLALFRVDLLLLAVWAVVTLIGAPLTFLVLYKVARYMHGDLD